jgi:hypothetical protein
MESNIARLQDGESIVLNDGLALKVFQEEVSDHCSCKTTVTDEMIASQTSFEE